MEGNKLTEKKEEKKKLKKIAWGITGSGDRLQQTFDVMKKIREDYEDLVDIRVYVSKAGDQVLKYYKLSQDLVEIFDKVWVETNANAPFLAGQMQAGKFEFLLIAPATSNTVAKIAMGLADSLLSNAAIMGLKAFVPIYIMPSDYEEGFVVTKIPDGRDLKLRVRKEDAEHVRMLSKIDGVFVLEKPEDIYSVFQKHFCSE
ncbi:MAG: archaeoflavoprotein AfpA [Candidatus Freyarchaeum deiterrae]